MGRARCRERGSPPIRCRPVPVLTVVPSGTPPRPRTVRVRPTVPRLPGSGRCSAAHRLPVRPSPVRVRRAAVAPRTGAPGFLGRTSRIPRGGPPLPRSAWARAGGMAGDRPARCAAPRAPLPLPHRSGRIRGQGGGTRRPFLRHRDGTARCGYAGEDPCSTPPRRPSTQGRGVHDVTVEAPAPLNPAERRGLGGCPRAGTTAPPPSLSPYSSPAFPLVSFRSHQPNDTKYRVQVSA